MKLQNHAKSRKSQHSDATQKNDEGQGHVSMVCYNIFSWSYWVELLNYFLVSYTSKNKPVEPVELLYVLSSSWRSTVPQEHPKIIPSRGRITYHLFKGQHFLARRWFSEHSCERWVLWYSSFPGGPNLEGNLPVFLTILPCGHSLDGRNPANQLIW